MAVRWTRLFVPFVFFLFLLSAVFPGAAGARVIHVPAGVPTLELAAGIATADDTVIVTDPALREKAARFEGLFNIVFPEVTPGFPAEAEGAGAPGPSQAPCVADWIEGLVTDTGGTPLPLINVVAFRAGTAAGTGAQTDAAGHYLICTDPGDYNVVFNFSSLNDYLSEVYDNKGFGCGDMVTVLSGQPVTVNASLVRAGAIRGTVTDGALPLAGAMVTVLGRDMGFNILTDASGNYIANGLRGGEYTLMFSEAAKAYEYYDNKGSLSDARLVSVTEGQTTSGIDAALSPGATLSGTVDDGTLPVQNALVFLNSIDGGYGTIVITDALGDYSAPGLRQGGYILRVSPPLGQPQWYSGKVSAGTADPVQVTPPAGVTGVDMTVKPAGSIQGVVSEGGVGFGNAMVTVYDQQGSLIDNVSTAFDGSFVVPSLLDGRYRVYGSGWFLGHENEWYGGTADPGESPVITIAGASHATGVDFDLSHITTGTMSGKVSYEGGQCSGIFGPHVMIRRDVPLSEYQMAARVFNIAATWQSPDLAPGDYLVSVSSLGGHHQEQWYPGVPAFSRSRAVRVSPGADRGGVDVKLPRRGRFPEPEVSFRTPSRFVDQHFDDVLNMGPGDKHPMSLDLACNGARGVPVDYWLLAFTPLPPPRNVYHFEPGRGWQPGLEVSAQGPCANQNGLEVTDVPYFPLGGDVDIYFGVDGEMNGAIDPATLFYNGMRVHMYK